MTFYARLAGWLSRSASGLRITHARLTGAEISPGCFVSAHCQLALGPDAARRGRISLQTRAHLGSGALLHPYGGSIVLEENVFLGPASIVYGHGGVVIGHDSLVSMHCRILSSNHLVPPLGTLIRAQPDLLLPTVIGPDVWLGAGVTVLGGVTIGDGCVVGAGAVVTKDLPPGTIALGVPARVVGQRHSPHSAS
jgi:acetyltransferase-like isoleucine patch superfamily enzyme